LFPSSINYFFIIIKFTIKSKLRKLKDKSYNLIKSELFDFKNNGDSYNEELSNKYGTSVYDMRNKDFFMLVRAENGHRDKDRWRRNLFSSPLKASPSNI